MEKTVGKGERLYLGGCQVHLIVCVVKLTVAI